MVLPGFPTVLCLSPPWLIKNVYRRNSPPSSSPPSSVKIAIKKRLGFPLFTDERKRITGKLPRVGRGREVGGRIEHASLVKFHAKRNELIIEATSEINSKPGRFVVHSAAG